MVFQKKLLLLVTLTAAFLAACTMSTPGDEQPGPEDPVVCPQDAKECPDGSYVGRDGSNNCEFFPCPSIDDPIACTADVICCDGQAMGRDPTTGCSCPEGMNLTPGACGPANGEGQEMACTRDAKACPDGSFVGRDGFNNCEFHPCPEQQSCDANTPCEEGFSCYTVSGAQPKCYTNDIDVCQFANCSENQTCVVMQSYPAQVACQ